MSTKPKRGTFIHGIAASEHLDSSGERIRIEGIDISSLTKDGVFNFEHQSKEASAIVGKILEAKKILSKDDCENDHHRYFWDKIQMPFLYVAGELFDETGHQAAKDVTAMLKYDQSHDGSETKKLINFSIEGSRLDKRGSEITKCIARRVSITITPCNKVAVAEELKIDDNTDEQKSAGMGTGENFSFVQDLMMAMGKAEPESSCQIMKGEWQPKRTFTPQNAPDKMRTGDRIDHTKQPRAKTGRDIYGKPPSEAQLRRQSMGKTFAPVNPANPNQGLLTRNMDRYQSNMRKAIAASMGMGTPGTKVQGSAVQKGMKTAFVNHAEVTTQNSGRFTKSEVQKVMKMLGEEYFETFKKKEELVDFITKKLPDLSKKEVKSIAKVVAYIQTKKKELALKDLVD